MFTILATRPNAGKSRYRRKAPLPLLAPASILCLGAILIAEPAQAVAGPSALLHSAPSSSSDTTDWIAAIAEAVTALSVIGVFWQIFITRSTSKSERTRAFQERYQSDAFAASAGRTLGCTKVDDPGQCVDVIEAWSNRRDAGQRALPRPHSDSKASVQDVEKTLSLFEEMGTAYNLKQLDKKTLHLSFAVPTVQVFVTAWWLICWLRQGRLARQEEGGVTEKTYIEFQSMCLALRKNDASLVTEPGLQPAPAVRALCLPRGHGEKVADGAAWSASRRITLALSAFVRKAEESGELGNRLSALAADIESLPVPSRTFHLGRPQSWPPRSAGRRSRPRGWDVILVPARIDQACDDKWKLAQFESLKLGQALGRFVDCRSLEVAVAHLEKSVPPG